MDIFRKSFPYYFTDDFFHTAYTKEDIERENLQFLYRLTDPNQRNRIGTVKALGYDIFRGPSHSRMRSGESFNSRWVAFGVLNQKYYNMFNTTSFQQDLLSR